MDKSTGASSHNKGGQIPTNHDPAYTSEAHNRTPITVFLSRVGKDRGIMNRFREMEDSEVQNQNLKAEKRTELQQES